ncbi:SARP family transcriptional regulator [Sphaerisporangium rufum]|uniref:SARP family transcriptional regulator n=1 Tax=Sphaerisporangium rufum TaxID=1381558 RepID=A0A919QZX8_9ACTN|nr:AfsR/SARP family transcriptional regulator [Sphaerisporangium rufum]GII77087.1 SARP family transcriptional regulator [Sphaerisporangium rufum]
MEFRVLGPLEVIAGGERLDAGGTRQRVILACLLLEAGRAVSVDRLAEAIYGDEPPPTSRAQVQICISALRRLLAAHGQAGLISTRAHGYVIHAGDETLDARRFETLAGRARRARDAGDPAEAVRLYRRALALWRGPEALAGIESRPVQAAAARLTEERVTTNEDCLQIELDLGRHQELVGELTTLVGAHPLRERLRGQLMIALYRSGRRAEALQVYRQAREAMVEELGIEPNERLQRLEHAILVADPALDLAGPAKAASGGPAGRPPSETGAGPAATAAPAASLTVSPAYPASPAAPPPVPSLLPSAVADFTGRTKQLDAIHRELAIAAEDPARFAVPVIVLTGRGGIGKTTVAVHAAHLMADRFPGGRLFADLHGGAARQVSPMQVLERFLRALGLPGSAMPDGLEERAETYRAMLAERGTLVVLDDAAAESQVLPLLPGTRSSAVIVTSRSRLAGLAGAVPVDLDGFDADQSVELLARIAGRDRVRAEPEATRTLAELCGRLPLALRIAGARLAARPHWWVEQLVSRLQDETRRLDELNHGEMGIRASIAVTYRSVGERARLLLRRLAVLEAGQLPVWIGAALLDAPFTEAADLFDELADAQLLEITAGQGVHGGYRFHDLVRVFARERLAAEETPAARRDALERALGCLLFLAEAAHRREYGAEYVQIHGGARRHPLPETLAARIVAEPLAWFERERPLLVSGIRQAAQAGFTELCWDLAVSAVTLFEARAYLDDWRETHETALAAARQAGDARGQAAMLYSRGSLRITEKRFPEARRDFEESLRLFEPAGDGEGTALALRGLGFLDRMSGRYAQAAAHYERALAASTASGDRIAGAYVLHNLAQLRLDTGDPAGAGDLLSRALTLSREGGSRRVEAQVLHRMGDTLLATGEPDRAAGVLRSALAIVRDIGDPVGEAYILNGLGLALLRLGDVAGAEESLRAGMGLTAVTGDRLAQARCLLGLGELALARDDPERAAADFEQALRLFRSIHTPAYEERARDLLAGVRDRPRGPGSAGRPRPPTGGISGGRPAR